MMNIKNRVRAFFCKHKVKVVWPTIWKRMDSYHDINRMSRSPHYSHAETVVGIEGERCLDCGAVWVIKEGNPKNTRKRVNKFICGRSDAYLSSKGMAAKTDCSG